MMTPMLRTIALFWPLLLGLAFYTAKVRMPCIEDVVIGFWGILCS